VEEIGLAGEALWAMDLPVLELISSGLGQRDQVCLPMP
jgi:hypothetical protein